MKIKTTALVISLALAAGFAQADVTISGDMTGGVKLDDRGSDNKDGVYLDGTLSFDGTHKIDAIPSSIIWRLSAGVNNSSGGSKLDDWVSVKDAYVGLQGDFGTARMGRLMTPSYDAQDALFTDTGLSWLAGDYGLGQATRINNIVRYDTPELKGFSAGAAFGFKDYNDDGNGSGKTYDVAAKYKLAGLQLDGTYQKRDGVTDDLTVGSATATQTFDTETYYAGARYELQNGLGFTAGYKHNMFDPGNAKMEQGQWLAQASYKQDKHAVYLSYAKLDDVSLNGAKQGDSGAQAYVARYNYSLNKNNLAFVEGRYVENEANSAIGAADNAFDYSGKAGQNTSRVMVGLKSFF
ncbi:porin [Chitinibacter tainanensis]|jgi:predicted porin|uniref:porin n=1 Tax=Chitinibacter tainanensis TaxID=230667 RepID=UPI0023545FAB|nr:porin [Chitinibacter tainanensis]